MTKKTAICVYCLKAEGTTREHVPANSIFPKPKFANLITVPSCEGCNSGFKKDEDYFLSILSFSEAGVTPTGKKLWDQKYHRMYQKDLGLKKALVRAFKKVQLPTQAGRSEERLAINFDKGRVGRVIEKICRGLYYFECDEHLGLNLTVEVHRITTKTQFEQFNTDMNLGRRGWPGIFEFRWNRVKEEPMLSKWLLLFHGTLAWGAITHTPGRFKAGG